MYETSRPHGLLAMLRLQHGDEIIYCLTGLVGALVGLLTSDRGLMRRLFAIPALVLVGGYLILGAWANLYDVDEQPYWWLVSIALTGVLCIVSAVWLVVRARPSRTRSNAS